MKHLLTFSIVVLLSVGFEIKEAEPVVVTLNDGRKFDAEIQHVRDSSVVLTTATGASDEELMSRTNAMMVIADRNIASVRIQGDSHTLLGAGVGALAGGAVGMAIGGSEPVTQEKGDILGCNAAASQSSNTVLGGAIGCAGGCLLGAVVGASTGSGSDIITPQQRDFNVLWRFQRYSVEPDYLNRLSN